MKPIETNKLYIVNDFDRPDERHIAAMREDGKLYYIHPYLRDVECYKGMSAKEATPVINFGIDLSIADNLLHGVESQKSIAQYSDGRTRRWQGDKEFWVELARPGLAQFGRVMLSATGQIGVFDSHDEQIPELQEAPILLWAKHAEQLGYEVDGLKVELPDRRMITLRRLESGWIFEIYQS